MSRRRFALLACVLCAPAAPALAQAWPAGAVVSIVSVRPPPPVARTFRVAEATTPSRPEPALKLRDRTAFAAEDAPSVDLRPRAEWVDDQGFSLTPKRISYKRRF